ncbi:MAG: HD domain-containing protein [Polyangiaceae bacterium]
MILRDPVHGLVTFEAEEEAVIVRLMAAREVQRLRRIRQLGLASLAFPGAEHTRFAHAIGAAHVMQRLLERLRQVDHELPFWQRVTSERARDALAAAFLHDLGHGPLSHLFEDALPDALPHETWTDRILLDPSTDVHKILVSQDANLPRRVSELVRGKHELPYLSKAVSGTLDVDRCDYLLRDAHATGVRYGEYDLPWLLRSLRFVDGADAGERAPTLGIDGKKGVSALESFVLARYFMFQQVYFHKSARAAELMVKRILSRALALVRDGVPLPGLPPALAAFAAGDQPSLGDYLDLDDQVLLGAVHAWERSSDPVLADLCGRLRRRDLFKSVELYDVDEAGAAEALGRARDIARDAGLDPEIYVGVDVAADTPYSEDGSLLVAFPRGRPRRPSEVSVVLERLNGAPSARTRVLFPAELRDVMREALIQ